MANARVKDETYVTITQNDFNTKYAFFLLGGNPLSRLEEIMCELTLFDNIQYLFQKSSELINSVIYYPFNVSDFAVTDEVGEVSRKIPIGRVDGDTTELVGYYLHSIIHNKLVASFTFTKANYFYELEPYTQMKIYLPYLGYYNLPVNEIRDANCTIEVRYSIDFDNGTCTAFVVNATKEYVLLTATGTIGVRIPIGSTNVNEVAKNVISSATKIVSGALTTIVGGVVGGPIGAVAGISGVAKGITGVVDLATNSVIHYEKGNLCGGSSLIASPNMCFIEIISPIPIIQRYEDERDFTHLYGKPLHEVRKLQNVTGFTKVGEIHLEDLVDATEPEIREIETLLKSGVIL